MAVATKRPYDPFGETVKNTAQGADYWTGLNKYYEDTYYNEEHVQGLIDGVKTAIQTHDPLALSFKGKGETSRDMEKDERATAAMAKSEPKETMDGSELKAYNPQDGGKQLSRDDIRPVSSLPSGVNRFDAYDRETTMRATQENAAPSTRDKAIADKLMARNLVGTGSLFYNLFHETLDKVVKQDTENRTLEGPKKSNRRKNLPELRTQKLKPEDISDINTIAAQTKDGTRAPEIAYTDMLKYLWSEESLANDTSCRPTDVHTMNPMFIKQMKHQLDRFAKKLPKLETKIATQRERLANATTHNMSEADITEQTRGLKKKEHLLSRETSQHKLATTLYHKIKDRAFREKAYSCEMGYISFVKALNGLQPDATLMTAPWVSYTHTQRTKLKTQLDEEMRAKAIQDMNNEIHSVATRVDGTMANYASLKKKKDDCGAQTSALSSVATNPPAVEAAELTRWAELKRKKDREAGTTSPSSAVNSDYDLQKAALESHESLKKQKDAQKQTQTQMSQRRSSKAQTSQSKRSDVTQTTQGGSTLDTGTSQKRSFKDTNRNKPKKRIDETTNEDPSSQGGGGSTTDGTLQSAVSVP